MDEEERDGGEDPGERNQEREVPQGISPWRDMFFRPRATTRWLLATETAATAQMMWLSFTAFLIVILFLLVMFYPGSFDRQVTKMQLVVFTPLIFLLSWLYFLAESYLLGVFARLLGGRCEIWEMRVVNSFTTVIPGVVLGLLRLGIFFLIDRNGPAAKLVDNIIMVWTAYITIGGITAAAGVTAWRALAVYLGTAAIWVAVLGAAAALLPNVAGLLQGLW